MPWNNGSFSSEICIVWLRWLNGRQKKEASKLVVKRVSQQSLNSCWMYWMMKRLVTRQDVHLMKYNSYANPEELANNEIEPELAS